MECSGRNIFLDCVGHCLITPDWCILVYQCSISVTVGGYDVV